MLRWTPISTLTPWTTAPAQAARSWPVQHWAVQPSGAATRSPPANDLLPEGAAIPANRGQLALLVWNTAGRPEPAGAPAFADVTDPDMAKAAQWCTEQGTMGAKGDRFEPEGWTPKFKVIEVWNKAFPAA